MKDNGCVRVREECMGYNGDGGCSSCYWGYRLEKGRCVGSNSAVVKNCKIKAIDGMC